MSHCDYLNYSTSLGHLLLILKKIGMFDITEFSVLNSILWIPFQKIHLNK